MPQEFRPCKPRSIGAKVRRWAREGNRAESDPQNWHTNQRHLRRKQHTYGWQHATIKLPIESTHISNYQSDRSSNCFTDKLGHKRHINAPKGHTTNKKIRTDATTKRGILLSASLRHIANKKAPKCWVKFILKCKCNFQDYYIPQLAPQCTILQDGHHNGIWFNRNS